MVSRFLYLEESTTESKQYFIKIMIINVSYLAKKFKESIPFWVLYMIYMQPSHLRNYHNSCSIFSHIIWKSNCFFDVQNFHIINLNWTNDSVSNPFEWLIACCGSSDPCDIYLMPIQPENLHYVKTIVRFSFFSININYAADKMIKSIDTCKIAVAHKEHRSF